MPLDPQMQAVVDRDAADYAPPGEHTSVEDRRRMTSQSASRAVAPDVARTADQVVPTPGGPVPVRVYWPAQTAVSPEGAGDSPPAGEPAGTDRLPLLVWFHGGGFVLGDLAGADATVRDLCAGSGAVVASVDYPLAPEHPFPAAPEACWAVTSWLAEHAAELGADGARVAVGGESAGGNLAAVTALLARDRGGPPLAFQLLVYPVTDLLASYPSVRENGDAYLLTTAWMDWFYCHYLAGSGREKDPLASPIYAEDLALLPPALVITAECDPLRDEGEAYAERLRLAGVKVTASRYDGMIHGFFGMTAEVEVARRAMAEAIAALRTALA